MKKIKVVGLGPGDLDQMPLAVYRLLKQTTLPLFLRTQEHPAAKELAAEGVTYETYDVIYEQLDEEFEEVYPAIVQNLLERAEEEAIVYAVPGHPMVAERTVELLLEEQKNGQAIVEIVGGKSFLDDLFQSVQLDPINGFQLRDAFDLQPDSLDLGSPLVILQVYNDFVASEVKLTLMELYPDEHQVAFVQAAGSKEESVTWVPLYQLDRLDGVFNLLSVYVPALKREERTRSFETLQHYIDVLFGEKGDQWIQAQTHETLLPYLMEETQEVIEAVENDDLDNIAEELGDVLLQVLYHSNLGEREGFFSLEDVLDGINRKIRRRHPHVFDGETAESLEEVEAIWQRVKAEEKKWKEGKRETE